MGIIGHVAESYEFAVCVDCDDDPTALVGWEHDWEPIYDDYKGELDEPNYVYQCETCFKEFIGNLWGELYAKRHRWNGMDDVRYE
jgi:hypothetical protein